MRHDDDPLAYEDRGHMMEPPGLVDPNEAQDAAFDAEHATDRMFERFLAGVRAADELGSLGIDDPAFALGELVGAVVRGGVALDPDLAPIWGRLGNLT